MTTSSIKKTIRKGLASCRALTLPEVMISMGIFSLVAMGVTATIIQVRKMAESNMMQVMAEAVAEGIIEQVQFIKYTDLSDTTPPVAPIPLKFIAASSTNQAIIQQIDVTWAPDLTTFTDVGETDTLGNVVGVLVDVDYRAGGTTLRRKRYLKMKINLQRQIDTTAGNVGVILTYKWAVPDRGTTAAPVYITGEMRTIKSQTASY